MKLDRPITARAGIALAITALLATGCANMDERQSATAKGAGIGALGGAVLGQLIGGNTKGTLIGMGVGAAAGAIGGNVWSRNMEEKRRAMEAETQGTGVEVSRTADNQLKVYIPNDIGFATNSAALGPDIKTVLEKFARGLDKEASTMVSIVGHTDSTGNDAINDPLSVRRAESVGNFLVGTGISATRIAAYGRGSHEPIATNDTAEGRARNRRVEIFLREPDPAKKQG